MGMKYFLIFSCLILVACQNNPPKIEVVDKNVPLLYVPKPPEIKKPDLIYPTLTKEEKENNPNLAIKYFGIDLKQIEDYSYRLELIINKYIEMSKKSDEMINSFLNDKNIKSEEKNRIKLILEKWKEEFK